MRPAVTSSAHTPFRTITSFIFIFFLSLCTLSRADKKVVTADGQAGMGYFGGPVVSGPSKVVPIFLGQWVDSEKNYLLDFMKGFASSDLFKVMSDYGDINGGRVNGTLTIADPVNLPNDDDFGQLTLPLLQDMLNGLFTGGSLAKDFAMVPTNTDGTLQWKGIKATNTLYYVFGGDNVDIIGVGELCGFHTTGTYAKTVNNLLDSTVQVYTYAFQTTAKKDCTSFTSINGVGDDKGPWFYTLNYNSITGGKINGQAVSVSDSFLTFNDQRRTTFLWGNDSPVRPNLYFQPNIIVHEIAEWMTNPFVGSSNAWVNPDLMIMGEIGDNCAEVFFPNARKDVPTPVETILQSAKTLPVKYTSTDNSTGYVYNTLLNSKPYLLQFLQDPVTNQCVTARPQNRALNPTPTTFLSPSQPFSYPPQSTPFVNKQDGSTPIQYLGGRVVSGTVTIRPIVYGTWPDPAEYQAILTFMKDFAFSSLFTILTDYADTFGGRVSGPFNVADPLVISDAEQTYSKSLSALGGVSAMINDLLANKLLPREFTNFTVQDPKGGSQYKAASGPSTLYYVLLGRDIELINTPPRLGCGFHDMASFSDGTPSNSTITKVFAYAVQQAGNFDYTQDSWLCTPRFLFNNGTWTTRGYLNLPLGINPDSMSTADNNLKMVAQILGNDVPNSKNKYVDFAVNTAVGILSGFLTNPWYLDPAWAHKNDYISSEVGLNCALVFTPDTSDASSLTKILKYQQTATTGTKKGYYYNIVVNGRNYLLQNLMDPVTYQCVASRPAGRAQAGQPTPPPTPAPSPTRISNVTQTPTTTTAPAPTPAPTPKSEGAGLVFFWLSLWLVALCVV